MVHPSRHLQAGVPVGTEAAHYSRLKGRCLDTGLQNTAEDIAEPQAVEGTGLPVVLGVPVALEGIAVPERTVVAAGTGKETAGTGMDIDLLTETWDPLGCSRLVDSLARRHLDRIQHRFDSLGTTK